MKKIILLIGLSILVGISYANVIDLGKVETAVQVLQSDDSGLELNYKLSTINSFTVNTDHGMFDQISIPAGTYSNRIGDPELPIIRKLIAVPFGAEVVVSANSYEEADYQLADFGITNPLMPSQLPVAKDVDPSEIAFQYHAEAYELNGFNDQPLVSAEEIGSMRGVRIFVVIVEPVKYNPMSGVIRVFNDIDVQVNFAHADLVTTANLRAKAYSPHFLNLFNHTLLNASSIQYRDEITRYPIKYVIISDPMFEAQLQPFIAWKIQQGFEIIESYTNDPAIGTTTTSIKAYLQGLWDDATLEDPAPSYVLFVGDVGQIPAWSGSTGSHITDLNYVKLDGNNIVPDMYYGRFSANNTSELQPQIDKTLMYEKYEMPDPSYLEEVVMIAGMDSSHGSTYGNGQINYGTDNYFNEAHGITSHTYLYPNSGSNASQIVQNVSDGVGYINYTAHGSATSWADPSFTIPNIGSLQNYGKYCMTVGNCCLTNKFEVTTCFGEAWLRAEDKGAIGYIGGTNSTYWDEDYWWGVGAGAIVSNPTYASTGLGAYDGVFHDHNELYEDWFTTAAGMIYRGNLAVTEGGGMINYYWEIYSLMGDPSLEAYMGIPSENQVTYPAVIVLGTSSVQVTAEPYSFVSLTMDGTIYGTVLVGETGSATLDYDPFSAPGTASLVITRQNKIPVSAEIDVIPSSGAYVIVDSFAVTDNNNGIPEYNESIGLDVTFENVGSEDAINVVATLSTTDTYITITTASVTVGDIAAGSTSSITDAFSMDVADNIPDQYTVVFNVEMASTSTWNSTVSITFHAPALETGSYVIDDNGGNGMLDPGETVTLSIPVMNAGNALSPEILAELTNGSPNELSLLNSVCTITALETGAEGWADFGIEVGANVAPGTIVTLGFLATGGEYSVSETLSLPVGLVYENFETGDFSLFEWQMGNYSWEITSANVYEGQYCAKSATISHNQTAQLYVTMDISTDGEISFYRKVSSESNYDYLSFYINNVLQEEWSGTVDWSVVSYDVAAGAATTFKWTYEKDGSVSSGSDCAWIDYIVFPGSGGATAPMINVNLSELDFGEVNIGETATETFTIYNIGTAELTGTIATPDGFTASLPNGEEIDFTVPAGGETEVLITFTPEEAILYSGNIVIESNDPTQSIIEIPTEGTGLGESNGNDLIPLRTELYGNYPNPFNPTTTVNYGLNSDAKVSLVIYNAKGQKVKTLVNEKQNAGRHHILWNGQDDHGKQVSSGIYFFRMDAHQDDGIALEPGDYTSVKKMLLLK